MKRLKSILGLFVYVLTIVSVLGASALWWLSIEFQKTRTLQKSILFQVECGQGLYTIGNNLELSGALHNKHIFNIAGRMLQAGQDLKAGEYELQSGMSVQDILELIRSGKNFQRRFTIREGLTSYEIINLLNNIKALQGEIIDIPAEGSLLPETYDYRKDENRERIINRLQQAMTNTINELWPVRVNNLPIKTKEEAIILASIVEKETGLPEERKRVAGVFINRLKRGIPLQTDPTVIYAITKGMHKNEGKGPLGRRLLKKDLEIDSLYNTYKYSGLPPGAIANPGRDSIEAVLNPEEHNFIYFVANGSGGHAFAKTLAEHNRNVAQWRKIRNKN